MSHKTLTEKIFESHINREPRIGEVVVVDVDFAMGQDGTSPLAIQKFYDMGGKKVLRPDRIALVIDHGAPSPTEGFANLHKLMRDFSYEQGIRLFDIGSGVCHQLIPESGFAGPYDIVVGADSHTCTYGAVGAFSTGIGSSELAAVMISGKLWFKIPPAIRVILSGKIPSGVYSKDIVLYLAKTLTADGATYKALEFDGDVINQLSMDARFTVSNMAVEVGAKAGIFPVDEKTKVWLREHGRDNMCDLSIDPLANYESTVEIDVSKLEPQIALPHRVDNVMSISEIGDIPIQEGYIGTCTNGRLEDMEIATSILDGKKIHPRVRLIVACASKSIYLEAMKKGLIEKLVEAGATVIPPGCGPCVGTHAGVPSDGENVISTANRNFKGRMGNNKAFIYLSSPATVAASCLTGKITDPRRFL
ncbi:MAG TPA: 3-isopropylmalate dehydratase large subunit [bacterium]|jgi:3-isopropylmalate/(R)-2-methylmalate dehydratase large subunit|nr:3-isopropylmalate dehydratase large subunit [Dictyoglomota bacterium]HOL54483.1 3-isopropylmalate dehydratase large subunit [bacterium]HON72100.1 3-isopropylmalate dehydratase large subunit [bacterium]HPO81505.1 3-isopropylmalate dehydratase large subunit [bacterium]